MPLQFGNKITNHGETTQGKLSANEFNQLVAQVNANEQAIQTSQTTLRSYIDTKNGELSNAITNNIPSQIQTATKPIQDDLNRFKISCPIEATEIALSKTARGYLELLYLDDHNLEELFKTLHNNKKSRPIHKTDMVNAKITYKEAYNALKNKIVEIISSGKTTQQHYNAIGPLYNTYKRNMGAYLVAMENCRAGMITLGSGCAVNWLKNTSLITPSSYELLKSTNKEASERSEIIENKYGKWLKLTLPAQTFTRISFNAYFPVRTDKPVAFSFEAYVEGEPFSVSTWMNILDDNTSVTNGTLLGAGGLKLLPNLNGCVVDNKGNANRAIVYIDIHKQTEQKVVYIRNLMCTSWGELAQYTPHPDDIHYIVKDTVQFGGVNLFSLTDFPKVWDTEYSNTQHSVSPDYTLSIVRTDWKRLVKTSYSTPLQDGELYTFSADVLVPTDSNINAIKMECNENIDSKGTPVMEKGKWFRIYRTVRINNTKRTWWKIIIEGTGEAKFKNLQIERGNQYTDYKLAPEDIEAQINAAKSVRMPEIDTATKRWKIWNDERKELVLSDLPSQGERGERGENGANGTNGFSPYLSTRTNTWWEHDPNNPTARPANERVGYRNTGVAASTTAPAPTISNTQIINALKSVGYPVVLCAANIGVGGTIVKYFGKQANRPAVNINNQDIIRVTHNLNTDNYVPFVTLREFYSGTPVVITIASTHFEFVVVQESGRHGTATDFSYQCIGQL